MPVNKDFFLWPEEEEKLVHHLIKVHKQAFAWVEEKGKFSTDYFEPVVIPTIEHLP